MIPLNWGKNFLQQFKKFYREATEAPFLILKNLKRRIRQSKRTFTAHLPCARLTDKCMIQLNVSNLGYGLMNYGGRCQKRLILSLFATLGSARVDE